MEILRAKRTESSALTEIAFSAKRHWGYPEKWISIWADKLVIRPDTIAEQETYGAYEIGRAVGFYSLRIGTGRAELDHLWVRPVAMKRGIGRALFLHAKKRVRALGFATLAIESDPHAVGFYERIGARRVGATVTMIEGESRELPLLIIEV